MIQPHFSEVLKVKYFVPSPARPVLLELTVLLFDLLLHDRSDGGVADRFDRLATVLGMQQQRTARSRIGRVDHLQIAGVADAHFAQRREQLIDALLHADPRRQRAHHATGCILDRLQRRNVEHAVAHDHAGIGLPCQQRCGIGARFDGLAGHRLAVLVLQQCGDAHEFVADPHHDRRIGTHQVAQAGHPAGVAVDHAAAGACDAHRTVVAHRRGVLADHDVTAETAFERAHAAGGIVHRVFVAEIEQLDGGVDLLVERLFGLGGRRAGRVRANQDDEHSEYERAGAADGDHQLMHHRQAVETVHGISPVRCRNDPVAASTRLQRDLRHGQEEGELSHLPLRCSRRPAGRRARLAARPDVTHRRRQTGRPRGFPAAGAARSVRCAGSAMTA
jgi:hypothetical protein